MKTAILTIGTMFSGKTTFAEQLVKCDPNYVIISRDNFRLSMFPQGHKFTQEDEAKITSLQYDEVNRCSKEGKNIIVTNSNLRMSQLRNFVRILNLYDYKVLFKFCEVDTQTIINKVKQTSIELNMNHILTQQELYNTMKEKLHNHAKFKKCIMTSL